MTEEQLNKEAEEYAISVMKFKEWTEEETKILIKADYIAGYRSRDKEVEELEYWKNQQMEVWLPVLNFMQENAHDIKPGSRISKRVLEILKEYYKTRLRGDD